MSYQKQAWRDYDDTKTELQNMQNGAVVTPERLNHIETGIANSANKEEVAAQLAQKANQSFAKDIENRLNNVIDGLTGDEEFYTPIGLEEYMTTQGQEWNV